MNQNRVILVLVAVVILFGVCLGIKIIQNTPEKQIEKVIAKANVKNEIQSIEENEQYQFNKEEFHKIKIFSRVGGGIILLICIAIIILLYIGNIKLYIKLGIPLNLLKLNIISIIIGIIACVLVGFATSIIFLLIIMFIIAACAGIMCFITSFIIQYQFFHAINTSFWFILIVLLPFVGTLILNVILGIRLADKFNKGIGYKLGLSILPITFRTILGFVA